MDVANFDFRLKSGLMKQIITISKPYSKEPTIKNHDITITLNLNGEVIATFGAFNHQ